MVGLFSLVFLMLWLLLGLLIGQAVFKWKRSRGLQLFATLLALWLPFWDAVPGYLLFQKAIREIGGIRIERTVFAEGYLDRTAVLGRCWHSLPSSPYAYCEHWERQNSRTSLGPLNATPGYYQYRLAPIEAPDCLPFREHLNVEYMQRQYKLGARCVVASHSDELASRYELAYFTEEIRGSLPIPPVIAEGMRVRDRASGQTTAQSTRLRYHFWISGSGRWLPFRYEYLRDESRRAIVLDRQEVIRPAISNRDQGK